MEKNILSKKEPVLTLKNNLYYKFNHSLREEVNSYNFYTKNNINYTVKFKPFSLFNKVSSFNNFPILSKFGYNFLFHTDTKTVGIYDELVPSTIYKILIDFFNSNQKRIIFWDYDFDKRSPLVRLRLYNRWFNRFETLDYTILNLKIPSEENDSYFSILLRKDHRYFNKLLSTDSNR